MSKVLAFIRKYIGIIIVAIIMLLVGSSFGPSQAQVEVKDTEISSLQKEIKAYKNTESEQLAAIEKLEKENTLYKEAEVALKKKEDDLKKLEEEKAAQVKKEKEEAAAKEAEELAAKKKAEQEEKARVAAEKAEAEQAAAEQAEAASASSSQSEETNTDSAASSSTETQFANCTELRSVHPAGVPKGHAAYQSKMDRDNDDYACEN